MSKRDNGEQPLVLRGPGPDLGPYATRFPLEERTILHVLRAQARALGERPWLVFDATDVLTFAEAERITNQVAAAIRSSIGTGKHTALYLRNQFEFMPAEMGAMAAPGVAVPLSAEAKGPLLQSVLERSDSSLIIARCDLVDNLAALDSLGGIELVVAVGDGPVPKRILGVPVVRWEQWLAPESNSPYGELPVYDDLAVIAFTSGTTGRAKGAVHTHHYWHLFSAIITDSLERKPTDVLTSPLPIHHGGALHLIANSSLHAGCLGHLQSRFSASRFWEHAARDEATYAFLLGPVAGLIYKQTETVPEHRMETIYCVPAPPQREEFESRFKVKLLWQGWAMTEVFPLVMRPDQMEGVPEDTIGYPVSWMDYGVVDEKDNMVGPGEVGELVWRSNIPHGMFSGYYNEPDLTLEAFRDFWFHTGDAASYEEDGMLRFRGRLRDRIRRRGELINAAELEYVAVLHPSVREAAAYGVPDELGEDEVKLDLVLSTHIEVVELHAWLTERLPRFMLPRYLEYVDEFPKTPSLRTEKYKLASRAVDRPEVFDAAAARNSARSS